MRMTEPFCDYLSLTYEPEASMAWEVAVFLRDHGAMVMKAEKNSFDLVFPLELTNSGLLRHGAWIYVRDSDSYSKIELPGKTLGVIRRQELYNDVLMMLATHPHRVTRLDVAVDYEIDGPDFYGSLKKRYPDDRCKLLRKSIEVKRIERTRDDGKITGSWYAGRRKNGTLMARCYDKHDEQMSKTGKAEHEVWSRCELEFGRHFSTSLADAYEPAPIFDAYSAPVIPDHPGGDCAWKPGGVYTAWTGKPKPEVPMQELLRRRVEDSMEITTLIQMADTMGEGGRAYLEKLVTERLRTGYGAAPHVDRHPAYIEKQIKRDRSDQSN